MARQATGLDARMGPMEMNNLRLNITAYLNRVPRWLLVVLVSLFPAVATLLLLGFLQADLRQFLPLGWNDQTWMWHQVLTFRDLGFNGGYYVVNEMPAAAQFSHFSSWGPVFPMMLGTLSRLTGWEPYTGILINIVLLTLTIGVFLTRMPFDRTQIVLTGLVLLTLTPVLMYVLTISQESFHQSAAFVVAALFYVLLTKQNVPRYVRWGFLLFLLFLTILRLSWVIFLVPLFIIGTFRPGKRGVVLALVLSGLIAIPIYIFIGYISAPGGNFLFTILRTLSTNPLGAIGNLLLLTVDNIYHFLLPLNGFTNDFVQAVQFVLLMVILAILGLQYFRAPKRSSATQFGADSRFNLYNLVIIFILALFFYRWNGFYRIFGVHLLVTLLLLIGFKHYQIVGAFVIVGLIGMPVFLYNYQRQYTSLFHQDRAALQLETMRATFEQDMVYQPETTNAWCNTVLVPTQFLDYHVMAVPARIGISFLWFGDVNFPLKSRYLLFDDVTYQDLKDRLHVESLASVPEGTLYRNLNSNCADG